MANKYINLYKEATAGTTNGTVITDDISNPLNAVVNSTDMNPVILEDVCIRCEEGFKTYGDTILTLNGANSSSWKLSLDGVTYLDSLTISDVIENSNRKIWVKCLPVENEEPGIDTTTSVNISATIAKA